MHNTKFLMAVFILLFSIKTAIFSLDIYNDTSLPVDITTLEYFQELKPAEYKFAVKKSLELYKSLKNKKYKYAKETAAIVFPELIHYSEYQDAIESFLNQILSSVTEDTNIFSIGLFQMKPIFAIKVENMLDNEPELARKYKNIKYGGKSDSVKERRERVKRLTKYKYQLLYLMAFVDFKVKELNLEDETIETRIKYLATSYNAGFDYDREKLDKYMNLENYPLKYKMFTNYSRICLDALQIIN